MKVWIVEHHIPHEDHYLIGVYDSEETAQKVADAHTRSIRFNSEGYIEVAWELVGTVAHGPNVDQDTVGSDCWWLTCVGCQYSSGPYETEWAAWNAWADHP